MTIVQINKSEHATGNFLLFTIGFRPFFIGAALFSTLSILAWTLVYSFNITVSTGSITIFEWHAHQMIYGFSMAVIAGFLLTAILNWTNIPTMHGSTLKALFLCWAVPRVLLLFGTMFIEIAAAFDLLFLLLLSYGLITPIVEARQWKQIGILTKIFLLATGNICFYLDAFGIYKDGAYVGVYSGLFLIISLILSIGGRIMPAFIRNGLEYPVDIRNPLWVAITSFIALLIFTVNFLFIQYNLITGITAGSLFVLTSYRLYCWYTPGIWSQSLIWGLFMSYLFIDIGFLLYALYAFSSVSPYLAAHGLAYGGIGLATLCMMIRVSLGHTGRNVRTPPKGTGLLILTLTLGASVRVLVPLIITETYRINILVSQVLWIIAFAGFAILFSRMLISPRVDGQDDIHTGSRLRQKPYHS